MIILIWNIKFNVPILATDDPTTFGFSKRAFTDVMRNLISVTNLISMLMRHELENLYEKIKCDNFCVFVFLIPPDFHQFSVAVGQVKTVVNVQVAH